MIVVNPIMGGGLSNAKLALADAVAANVLSGKKFYSGDKTLKTGTLSLAATATPADVVAGKTFFAGGTAKKTGTRSSGTTKILSATVISSARILSLCMMLKRFHSWFGFPQQFTIWPR